jgi:hypothetical protein
MESQKRDLTAPDKIKNIQYCDAVAGGALIALKTSANLFGRPSNSIINTDFIR